MRELALFAVAALEEAPRAAIVEPAMVEYQEDERERKKNASRKQTNKVFPLVFLLLENCEGNI